MSASVCRRVWAGASIVTVAMVLAAPLRAQDPARTTNDGVYTEAQASRGQKTFEGACTVCHDVDRFRGNDFVNSWRNQPLLTLFDTLTGTMPADNPGGLKPQEYADVISYFLKLNRYPVGTDELVGTKQALGAIKLEPAK